MSSSVSIRVDPWSQLPNLGLKLSVHVLLVAFGDAGVLDVAAVHQDPDALLQALALGQAVVHVPAPEGEQQRGRRFRRDPPHPAAHLAGNRLGIDVGVHRLRDLVEALRHPRRARTIGYSSRAGLPMISREACV